MDTQQRSRKEITAAAPKRSRSKSTDNKSSSAPKSRSKSPRKPASSKSRSNKSTSNASSAKSPSKKQATRPKSISKSPLSRRKRENSSSTATAASATKGARVYTKKELSEQQQKPSTSPTPARRTTRSVSQASQVSPKQSKGANNQAPLVSLFEDSRLKQEMDEQLNKSGTKKSQEIDLSDVRDYVLRKRMPPASTSTPYRPAAAGGRLATAAKTSTCKVSACCGTICDHVQAGIATVWSKVPAAPKWWPKWAMCSSSKNKWMRIGYLRFQPRHVWCFLVVTMLLVVFLATLNRMELTKFDPIKFSRNSATWAWTGIKQSWDGLAGWVNWASGGKLFVGSSAKKN